MTDAELLDELEEARDRAHRAQDRLDCMAAILQQSPSGLCLTESESSAILAMLRGQADPVADELVSLSLGLSTSTAELRGACNLAMALGYATGHADTYEQLVEHVREQRSESANKPEKRQ